MRHTPSAVSNRAYRIVSPAPLRRYVAGVRFSIEARVDEGPRPHGRTRGPAVDARRLHGVDEPAGRPAVAGYDGVPGGVRVDLSRCRKAMYVRPWERRRVSWNSTVATDAMIRIRFFTAPRPSCTVIRRLREVRRRAFGLRVC